MRTDAFSFSRFSSTTLLPAAAHRVRPGPGKRGGEGADGPALPAKDAGEPCDGSVVGWDASAESVDSIAGVGVASSRMSSSGSGEAVGVACSLPTG